jgi:DNA-binding MarR family transcriptional regulator
LTFPVYESVHAAYRALFRDADQRLYEAVGLSIVQFSALLVLEQRADCPLGELAEALTINASAVTTLFERLERLGYASRVPSGKDRRIVCARLSEEGRAVVERARPVMQQRNEEFLAEFTPEEIEIVRRFLRTLVQRSRRHRSRSTGGAARGRQKGKTDE